MSISTSLYRVVCDRTDGGQDGFTCDDPFEQGIVADAAREGQYGDYTAVHELVDCDEHGWQQSVDGVCLVCIDDAERGFQAEFDAWMDEVEEAGTWA